MVAQTFFPLLSAREAGFDSLTSKAGLQKAKVKGYNPTRVSELEARKLSSGPTFLGGRVIQNVNTTHPGGLMWTVGYSLRRSQTRCLRGVTSHG